MQKDLLEAIQGRMPEFSKGQRSIAKYILEHYDEAAYMTAAKLGAVADVSESTVVRFATALGYDGYPEFLCELSEYVKSKLTAVQRVDVTKTRVGEEDLLTKVMSLDAECVRKTLGSLSREAFARAVKEIVGAKNIYIVGIRSSASLAQFLFCYLQLIIKNVRLVAGSSASEMFEQTVKVEKGDVIIGISFPRYSQRTVNILKFAKKRGATVISITDSERSPLSKTGDCNLFANVEIMSYVDSLVAPLSVINALLVAVSLERPQELRGTLAELEGIWDEYHVYDKNEVEDES